MESEKESPANDLPAALVAKFKSADQPLPLITSRVDRNISRLAHAQFSDRRQAAWRSRPAWAAIAATVLIALIVVESGPPITLVSGPIYADIDGSGRIDIADVLALARSAGSDKLSRMEVDGFAARIVSLSSAGDAS